MTRATSILLTISFIIVSLTGVIMDLRPRGGPAPTAAINSDANQTAPAPVQEPPARQRSIFPRQLHIWSGYLFMIVSLVHIALNWHPLLWAFGLRRKRREAQSKS
ncbi:MAG: DUF4405 domain-containing protein [Armatimonadota bacterium]